MKRPLLEVLRDWSGLVVGGAALLYVFGYTVHWACFRLLGLAINGQPFDYLRFAADFATSVLGSLPQLIFAFTYYSPKLIHAPLLTSTIVCSLIVIASFLLYVVRKSLTKVQKRKPSIYMVLWWGLNVLIIISFSLLLSTEFDIAKIRNVLQPVDAADVQQMQNQLSGARNLDPAALLELRGRNVVRIYEKYTQTQKDSPGFRYFNDWFNPTIRPNNSTERRAVYLALLLLNLIILSAIIVQLLSLKSADIGQDVAFRKRIGPNWSRMLVGAFVTGLVIQLFLFPFIYATLGRNLNYPVVMLKLAAPFEGQSAAPKKEVSTSKAEPNVMAEEVAVSANSENWTHCVYFIADLGDEIIVYDRLNFFQVKRIPRSRILTISQLFTASPFESCSKDQETFTPCETLWMSEQTPILDF